MERLTLRPFMASRKERLQDETVSSIVYLTSIPTLAAILNDRRDVDSASPIAALSYAKRIC